MNNSVLRKKPWGEPKSKGNPSSSGWNRIMSHLSQLYYIESHSVVCVERPVSWPGVCYFFIKSYLCKMWPNQLFGTFFFFKKENKTECSDKLGNTIRPRRPWKTSVVDDRRIISLMKKKPFTPLTSFLNRKTKYKKYILKKTKTTLFR